MNVRDLIPWNRSSRVPVRRAEEGSPFLPLHCEMNRLFFNGAWSWPNIEVSETDKEMKVIAELPGLEEKDVEVKLSDGVLAIKGEKKTEMEDEGRVFSERYYGRFERRIPVEDIEEDKVSASFRNGVLTVTLPKLPEAQRQATRIPINGN